MVLIGYWPLNETNGTTAYDHSGNENHGTANGAGPQNSGVTDGPIQQSSYSFDGQDDYVNISTSFSLSSSNFSISLWFNTPRTTGTNNEYQGLYVWNSSPSGFWTKNDSINYYSSDGSGDIVTGGSYKPGEWNHAAFVRRGDTHELYLNGNNVGKVTESYTDSSDTDHYIGNRTDASRPFEGSLSEVRTYGRALSPQEISYLNSVGRKGVLTTDKKSS